MKKNSLYKSETLITSLGTALVILIYFLLKYYQIVYLKKYMLKYTASDEKFLNSLIIMLELFYLIFFLIVNIKCLFEQCILFSKNIWKSFFFITFYVFITIKKNDEKEIYF